MNTDIFCFIELVYGGNDPSARQLSALVTGSNGGKDIIEKNGWPVQPTLNYLSDCARYVFIMSISTGVLI